MQDLGTEIYLRILEPTIHSAFWRERAKDQMLLRKATIREGPFSNSDKITDENWTERRRPDRKLWVGINDFELESALYDGKVFTPEKLKVKIDLETSKWKKFIRR
jgi:hypothetical protein